MPLCFIVVDCIVITVGTTETKNIRSCCGVEGAVVPPSQWCGSGVWGLLAVSSTEFRGPGSDRGPVLDLKTV